MPKIVSAALRHHLHQVPEAELETQVPPREEDSDLTIKVATLEQFIQTQEPGHRNTFRLSGGHSYRGQVNCTRAGRKCSICPRPFFVNHTSLRSDIGLK
jgi:hypothetical protein